MSQMCCLEESIVVFAVEIHQEVDVQQDIIVVLVHQFQLLMIVIHFMWVMLVRLVLVWIRPQLVILVVQVIIVQKDHHLLFNVLQVPTQVLWLGLTCEFDCPSCTCVKGYLLLFFEWYNIDNSSMFGRIWLSNSLLDQITCPAGTYQNLPGSTGCVSCPPGVIVNLPPLPQRIAHLNITVLWAPIYLLLNFPSEWNQ
jgi:hypothetical protein